MKDKIIEKLVETIMHVGGFKSESFTINDVVKELEHLSCSECLKFASELSALQESGKEEKPKHPTSWRDFTMTDKE